MAQTYYIIANVLFAIGMLSVCLAIAVMIYNKKARSTSFAALLSLLLFLLSLSGLDKALLLNSSATRFQIISDTLMAILAVVLGYVVWPHLRSLLTQPSYEEITDTNKQLEYYRHLFDSFMDHSPTIAFLKDQNGKLLYVNKAFEKTFKLDRKEILGQPAARWLHYETGRIEESDKLMLESNQPLSTIEYVSCCSEPQPWLTIKFPVPGLSASSETAIGGVSINIADRLEIAELDARLAAIVESSQDAIVSIDMNGIIRSWNKGAEELYGYTAAEAEGQNLSLLIESKNKDEISRLLDKLNRGVRIDYYETVHITKNGAGRYVSVSLSPVKMSGGTACGAALIARDISREKIQQSEIEKLNKQLKDRVYELAEQSAALQSARDQALEASNLKSAFCANISHEIRTPLSGIIGLNEMLLQCSTLRDEERDMAELIQQSAEALLAVVNDILDLSKIEAGKIILEYAPFNPIGFLNDCSRPMAPSAHQKGLTFELWIDPKLPDKVYGDVSRLRQVLLELIGNALKFTETGTVSVRAEVIQLDEERSIVEFSVKDTGIGIASKEQRYLFTPFQQLDSSSTRRFAGAGLGLAISKRFVEMMGGEIGLNSDKGKGTVFWFRISFGRKHSEGNREIGTEKLTKFGVEPVPLELAAGRRILVVEDNLILQELALRQLASLGVEAEATIYGRQAIEMAVSDRFHLILMDINLPDITGLEATAVIRNLEESAQKSHIPIIAMTAGAMPGAREKAIASGMNDYLSKPVPIEILKRFIEIWLRRSPIPVLQEFKSGPDRYNAA